MDALRCAVTVPGAKFHWLKVNILWLPKSTPEMISKKRQEMRASTTTCTGKNNSAELKDPLKKQLNFENPESPAVFDKEMEATALKDAPVDRLMSKNVQALKAHLRLWNMRESRRTTLKGSYLEQHFIIPVLFLSVVNVTLSWDTPEETEMEMNVHPPCCVESLTSILMTKL